MRHGYWTGLIVGGILGIVATKVYGDRLIDSLFPGMVGEDGEADEIKDTGSLAYRPRGRRIVRREC